MRCIRAEDDEVLIEDTFVKERQQAMSMRSLMGWGKTAPNIKSKTIKRSSKTLAHVVLSLKKRIKRY